MSAPAVSVIIPTLNAAGWLPGLLQSLRAQTLPPCEIIVADSGSADGTREMIAPSDTTVRLLPVAPGTFDHGGTRHAAFAQSRGAFVCFLTQDAVPLDNTLLAHLTAPFADETVGCVYGRQLARADASPAERLTREFNYPPVSHVYGQGDVTRLGVRAYFFSDACAAYRKTAYEAVGGFARRVPTNEDMLIASRMLQSGFHVAYSAAARVYHSHGLSLPAEFKRYFDIGAFFSLYRDQLGNSAVPLRGEGWKYVRFVTAGLIAEKRFLALFPFWLRCGVRMAGKQAGSRYRLFGRKGRIRLSGNPGYWATGEKSAP